MKVYRRANHWWFAGTVNGQHVRYSLGKDIKTEAEARAWLANFEKTEKGLELRQAIKDYLLAGRTRLAQTTILRYKDTLKAFENYFGVTRRVDQITGKEINEWVATRLQQGLSPETVNMDIRHLKAFLNRLVDWELLAKLPKIEKVKAPKRLPRHLTVEQVQAIIDAEVKEPFKRIYKFMAWTGVRRAEAVNLRWEDISLGDVSQALITGKGDRQRVIPLVPPAVEALGAPEKAGVVFAVFSVDYVTHRFVKAAKAAGVKARLHDLRHTCLTWLVAHGVPLKLVQDIAGHSDIKTTLNYAKTFAGGAYDTLVRAFRFAE